MTRALSRLALAALLGLPGLAVAQDNPLARPPAWVGSWKGEQVALKLEREAGAAKGELNVGGNVYPLTATPKADDPNRLEGSFVVNGHNFACTLQLTPPDQLTLTSDGASHVLAREAPPSPANPLGKSTPNPLGGPPSSGPDGGQGGLGGQGLGGQGLGGQGLGGQGSLGGQAGGGALADAWSGPAQRRQFVNGAWSCELPAGFSVANEEGLGLLINPGIQMQPGTMPDALVACEIGELSPAEAQQPAQQLLRAVVPTLQQMLQGQGIQVAKPSEPVLVQVDGLPAGIYDWSGQNMAQQPFSVWMGVVVRGPRYVLVLSVIQKGKEAAYLAKIKRVFSSTRIAAGNVALPAQGGQGGQGGFGEDEGN